METVLDKERVEEVLEMIRPALQRDGGDILLMGLEGSTVKVRLMGACSGCPSSTYTLRLGVERHLKTMIPEIKEVVSV
ncbi:MAG TPA: NifU family protein [Nitrospirota bacterium]|nr:NifU family protein [Nitrospirota bacterium]